MTYSGQAMSNLLQWPEEANCWEWGEGGCGRENSREGCGSTLPLPGAEVHPSSDLYGGRRSPPPSCPSPAAGGGGHGRTTFPPVSAPRISSSVTATPMWATRASGWGWGLQVENERWSHRGQPLGAGNKHRKGGWWNKRLVNEEKGPGREHGMLEKWWKRAQKKGSGIKTALYSTEFFWPRLKETILENAPFPFLSLSIAFLPSFLVAFSCCCPCLSFF